MSTNKSELSKKQKSIFKGLTNNDKISILGKGAVKGIKIVPHKTYT